MNAMGPFRVALAVLVIVMGGVMASNGFAGIGIGQMILGVPYLTLQIYRLRRREREQSQG